MEFCSSTKAEAFPVAPGRIIAGDKKIGAGVAPFSVLELADDIIELDVVELRLDVTELAIDDVVLAIDELELEAGGDDGADDEGALLLDAVSYAIGNNGFP